MDGYITNVQLKVIHKPPTKLQLSSHQHCEIMYGNKHQMTQEEDNTPALDLKGIYQVQAIVGSLLYYTQSVNNKLLVGLSAIGTQQAAATEKTEEAINQILNHVATYPNNGITYCAINMVLAIHADAGFNNESKARSWAGARIFLSKDGSAPK